MSQQQPGPIHLYANYGGDTCYIAGFATTGLARLGMVARRGVYPGARLFIGEGETLPYVGDSWDLRAHIESPTKRRFNLEFCGQLVSVESWRYSTTIYRVQTVNSVTHISGNTSIYGEGATEEAAIADLTLQLEHVIRFNDAPMQAVNI